MVGKRQPLRIQHLERNVSTGACQFRHWETQQFGEADRERNCVGLDRLEKTKDRENGGDAVPVHLRLGWKRLT